MMIAPTKSFWPFSDRKQQKKNKPNIRFIRLAPINRRNENVTVESFDVKIPGGKPAPQSSFNISRRRISLSFLFYVAFCRPYFYRQQNGVRFRFLHHQEALPVFACLLHVHHIGKFFNLS